MIAQINTGEGFGGLVNYANDILKKDTMIIASEGVSLSSNAAITACFKAQAKSRSNVKNFVGHISLSFSPQDSEKVNDERMAEIANEYMRRMGIINTQFVVFRHKDQPHPHIHIVYNRVDNDGRMIKGDTSFKKSIAITKALTRKYGLSFGKDKSKVRRERLKGKDAIKYRLYDEITAAIKDSISWQELRKVLSAKGISLDFVRNEDGSIRGVTFTDNEHKVTFAGSKIDHSLSFAKIDRQMYNIVYFDDSQETESLQIQQKQEESFDINDAFDFSHSSSEIGQQEGQGYVEQQSVDSGDSGSSSSIGAAIAEALLQPHVAPTSSGGGNGPSGGWRDEDDDYEKNRNKNKPRKRGR